MPSHQCLRILNPLELWDCIFCLPPAGPKSLASLWHPPSLVYSWQSLSGWRRQRSANFHPIGKMWRPDFAHLFSFTWFTMRNCGPLVFPKDDTCMVLDKQGISQKEDKGIELWWKQLKSKELIRDTWVFDPSNQEEKKNQRFPFS